MSWGRDAEGRDLYPSYPDGGIDSQPRLDMSYMQNGPERTSGRCKCYAPRHRSL